MTTIVDKYNLLFGKGAIQDASVVEFSEHGRSGGVSTGQGFKFTGECPMALKVTVSGSVTYVGTSLPGTAQSAALWQAQSIDTTTGVIIKWADGNPSFDNVATDLTTLTYS